MEKLAVIEVKTTSVKLQLVDIVSNKYFETSKVVEMPINLTKDFYSDMFIKPTVIKEINEIVSPTVIGTRGDCLSDLVGKIAT